MCVLILTMTTAFFVTFAMSDPPGLQLAGGLFIPEMKSYAVLQGTAHCGLRCAVVWGGVNGPVLAWFDLV